MTSTQNSTTQEKRNQNGGDKPSFWKQKWDQMLTWHGRNIPQMMLFTCSGLLGGFLAIQLINNPIVDIPSANDYANQFQNEQQVFLQARDRIGASDLDSAQKVKRLELVEDWETIHASLGNDIQLIYGQWDGSHIQFETISHFMARQKFFVQQTNRIQ